MLKNIEFKIFITVFILIALHSTPDGAQSNRYLDAIHSLVSAGTFALHKGYLSHIDVVSVNDNFYAVIPPGVPLLLAPLYFLHRSFMSVIGIPIGEDYWAIFNFLSNALVTAPLLGLVAIMMFQILNKFTENTAKKLWLVFILIFGSLVFFYSTNGIWSHVYTMTFLFTGFYLIINHKNNFLIGLCLGWAQLFDYIAIIPISLLMGFWLYKNMKFNLIKLSQNSFFLLLGYAVFLSVLLFYNYSITGSIFQTPNSLYLQELNQQGVGTRRMLSLPALGTLWGLTFSPHRGIFLYFPMTFLFIASLVKKSFIKNDLCLFSAIFVTFIFIFNATYYAWSGDVCFGPRHLVVAIPFIIIPIVYCPLKYIKIFGALSICINLAGVSTIPSSNLFINIIMFLYRGPFLHSLDYVYKIILPKYYNLEISLMTPFFIYVATALLIYLIWKPNLSQKPNLAWTDTSPTPHPKGSEGVQ